MGSIPMAMFLQPRVTQFTFPMLAMGPVGGGPPEGRFYPFTSLQLIHIYLVASHMFVAIQEHLCSLCCSLIVLFKFERARWLRAACFLNYTAIRNTYVPDVQVKASHLRFEFPMIYRYCFPQK